MDAWFWDFQVHFKKKTKKGSEGFQSIDRTNTKDVGFLRSSLWQTSTQPKMKDQTKVAFLGPPKVSNFPHSTNFEDLGIMFSLESLNFIKLGV